MKYNDLITVDADILNGTPVFKGTRVPAQSLFWHLEQGVSLEEFLDEFPTVQREQAMQLINLSGKLFSAIEFKDFYETSVR